MGTVEEVPAGSSTERAIGSALLSSRWWPGGERGSLVALLAKRRFFAQPQYESPADVRLQQHANLFPAQ
jgi:hypothetical protein